MKLAAVVGARPNFVKVAPILAVLQQRSGVSTTLIHTGQHYDAETSGSFFADLELPGVAHVEAGLRSFDRSMPEELNRVLTDQISDLLGWLDVGRGHWPAGELPELWDGKAAARIVAVLLGER